MGRELVRQLVAEGCNVAMCDVSARNMAETQRLCEAARPRQGLRITTHVADVSDEAQVVRFRDAVTEQQETDKIHLLFNNAGISGGGSMIANSRDEWERIFNICWGGVYLNTRAFLPMLQKADQGHIVNTSSINGFWAIDRTDGGAHRLCRGEIRGQGLQRGADHRSADQRAAYQRVGRHARPYRDLDPHQYAEDSSRARLGRLTAAQIEQSRAWFASMGRDPSALSDEEVRALVAERARRFIEEAPTTAAEAATIILDGVKAGRWRILVGADAASDR